MRRRVRLAGRLVVTRHMTRQMQVIDEVTDEEDAGIDEEPATTQRSDCGMRYTK